MTVAAQMKYQIDNATSPKSKVNTVEFGANYTDHQKMQCLKTEFRDLSSEFKKLYFNPNQANQTANLNTAFQKLIHMIQDHNRLRVIYLYQKELVAKEINSCFTEAFKVLTEK